MEDWGFDVFVRVVPCEAVQGELKITAICGRNFTKEERGWYHKLYMAEMEERRGK
jgi:hypothetical protein